jgi:hypothetical protein
MFWILMERLDFVLWRMRVRTLPMSELLLPMKQIATVALYKTVSHNSIAHYPILLKNIAPLTVSQLNTNRPRPIHQQSFSLISNPWHLIGDPHCRRHPTVPTHEISPCSPDRPTFLISGQRVSG